MRHFLAQFGPALQLPWTRLTDVPELTDELLDGSSRSPTRRPRGRSMRELERLRDDCLVAIIQGLRTHGFGAGAVLAELRARAVRRGARGGAPGRRGAAPLRLHAAVVPPEWVDYNGHAHESRYLQVFGDTTDALLRTIGIDAAYLAAGGSYFTVETHLSHLGQARAEERLHVDDPGARPRREAPARLPRAPPHRRTTRCWPPPSRCSCTSTRARTAPRRPRRRCSTASPGSPPPTPPAAPGARRPRDRPSALANLARKLLGSPRGPGRHARGQDEALPARRARRGRRGHRHRAEREAGRAPGAGE